MGKWVKTGLLTDEQFLELMSAPVPEGESKASRQAKILALYVYEEEEEGEDEST